MAPFTRHGTPLPPGPVVLSVPHAGRDYPAALLAAARVPVAVLQGLEDRYVDTLALAAHAGEPLLIQHAPRALIDLNRGEDERDPAVDEGARGAVVRSAKVRGGLGLVPRRVGAAGDLWRRRWSDMEVCARIATLHRPFHAALADALAHVQTRWGTAVLLDVHSMPPLPGANRAQVVIGDRFGRTAPARLVARVEAEAVRAGLRVALNTPYAGGHLIERHADPAAGRHAIQIEFDRSLYLDASLDRPGPGFAATAALLRAMAAAVRHEAMGGWPMAAE